MYAYKSVQDDEYICKIRCSMQRFAFQAATINFKLPLDEEKVKEMCAAGLPEYNTPPPAAEKIPAYRCWYSGTAVHQP